MTRQVIVEEKHDLPLVHFQVVLPTGSLLDPEGKEGLTRLAARLIRRGTKNRESREVEELIDGLGAELAIETSPGHIRLSGSAITRSLEPMFALLSEIMHEPRLSEHELDLSRRETHAALIELTDSDSSLASIHFRRALFRGHPYGRPSVGTHASLDAVTPDDVRRTYHQQIEKARPWIGFAGDVTYARALELAEKFVLPNREGDSTRMLPPEPAMRKGRHLRLVDKPERTQTQIQIGRLGTHPKDPDHTALIVGNAVFGGAFTARLMRAVRSERGWSYGASSRLAIDRVRDAWSMWTFPAASDAGACIDLQLSLMEQWVDQGITDEELAFAKSYLIKSYAFATDTADKRLEQAIEVELYNLPSDYFSNYTERVQSVTRDEVNAALRARLDPNDLVLSIVGTEADLGARLRELPKLASTEVVPFDAT